MSRCDDTRREAAPPPWLNSPRPDRLRDAGIAVHVVGCGSPGGVPIPLRGPEGRLAGYKKDRQGQTVATSLDEELLEGVAAGTGGVYVRATASEVELGTIADALAGLESGELSSQVRTRYRERFYVPLTLALLALVAETLIGDRKRSRV